MKIRVNHTVSFGNLYAFQVNHLEDRQYLSKITLLNVIILIL